MSKFSHEEKVEAVLRCVNDGMSPYQSAKILGCNTNCVEQWLALYSYYGVGGLVKGYGAYTSDFKLHVVQSMQREHLSPQSAAAKFGIPSKTTVATWERIFLEEGAKGLAERTRYKAPQKTSNLPETDDLTEVTKEDLITEIQRLRMENEYLKKLRALVQERIARENGNEPPSSMN